MLWFANQVSLFLCTVSRKNSLSVVFKPIVEYYFAKIDENDHTCLRKQPYV